MKAKRPCVVCGKECEPHQRNVDGTYLHSECVYKTGARMVKTEKS